jgi:hypothetical protein
MAGDAKGHKHPPDPRETADTQREKLIIDSDDYNHHEAHIMPLEGFNNCPEIPAYAVSVFLKENKSLRGLPEPSRLFGEVPVRDLPEIIVNKYTGKRQSGG